MGCSNSVARPVGEGTMTPMSPKKRVKNVFEASPNTHFQKEVTAAMTKNAETEAMIRSALKKNNLLSAGMDANDMDVFVRYSEFKVIESGTVVIKEKDDGDLFYIIQSGTFSVTVNDTTTPLPKTTQSFGEMALLFNAPRSATITATSHAETWVIDRVTFRHGIAAAKAKHREETSNMLSKVKILHSLTPSQLEHIADVVIPQTFKEGATVISKGASGDVFYIIASGEFSFKDIAGVTEPIVKSRGEYFGEMALLTGDKRNATVVAKTDGKLLALSRENFDSAVGPLKELVEMSSHREMLQDIEILKNLDDTERMNAVRHFVPVTYKSGQIIIKEGAPGDAFFVISEGTVSITKAEAPNFTASMSQGQFFGEMALLNRHDKRSATVTAKTDVKAYMLTRVAFQQIVVGDIAEILQTSAAERIKKQKESGKVDIAFEDLKTIAMLGAGTFGRVSLVQDKNKADNVFALKCLHKSEVVAHKQQDNVMNEKNIMIMCNHPFILRLFNTYTDRYRLYMLLEFCPGGELFTVLHTPTKDGVSPSAAKFYCAGCAMALGYLSDRDIMYRDLKPENMLVDIAGYPKIIDFGFAKQQKAKTYTLCGTPEYMAPEIILGRGYDKGVDWWALGVLLYECIAGYSPFCDPQGMDQQVICQNIVNGRLKFPRSNFDQPAKDLCRALLSKDSSKRPGVRVGSDVLEHAYFNTFDFQTYEARNMKAPWLPPVKSKTDASNFDPFDVDNSVDQSYKDSQDWFKDF